MPGGVCRDRGDPGLPFHKVPILAGLAKAVAAALEEQDFMGAASLKLKASIIAHHQAQAEQTARALRGLAQVSAGLSV